MDTRLTSLLTVLSLAFTGLAGALILAGPGPAVVFGGVSALALAGWLWTGLLPAERGRGLVAPYLTLPPLLLLLESLRYADGWVGQIATRHAAGFAPLVFQDAPWFALLVCAPVSLILFGGYLLCRDRRIGHYMAWWAAFYAVAQGLVQIALTAAGGRGALALLACVPALALVGTGLRLFQGLIADRAAAIAEPAPLTDRQRRLWAVLFVVCVVLYAVPLLRQAGPLPVVVIVGSMLGGMVGWWRTTSRRPADPARAVPLFLLLLTFFYIHVGEEALTDFSGAIAAITGVPWREPDFMLLIGLLGPAVWFLAAWSLWRRQPAGNFVFWFLIVGMILGEPTHLLVFPFVAMAKFGIGYEYFSGMYTALFPMIPAILALVQLVTDHREWQRGRV